MGTDVNLKGSSRKSLKKNKKKRIEEVVIGTDDEDEDSEEGSGDEEEVDEQYVVEKILDKKTDSEDGSVLYRVKWKGFGYDEATWEPLENLTDDTGTCVHLEKYEEKIKSNEAITSEEEAEVVEVKKKRKRK